MSLPPEISPAIQCVVYQAPFLAHLAMALRWRMDPSVETACTDGVEVRVSPAFFGGLTPHERAGLIAHEALHCALRHSHRAVRLVRTPADAALYNVCADIVVNGALDRAGLVLPKGAIRDRKREHMAVEQIYRALKKNSRSAKMGRVLGARLRDLDVAGAKALAVSGEGPDDGASEIDWPSIIRRADILARRHGGEGVGSGSLHIDRELAVAMGEPTIDWRSVLWRFLAESPSDWGGFDRRHVWRGGYIPTLVGQRLRAVVGIDVSGSIDDNMLKAFLAELGGVLRAVENLEIDLFWTDTQVHGPEKLDATSDLGRLRTRGGGGTDLGPLFLEAEKVAEEEGVHSLPCIYLTDGHGPTLAQEPACVEALWVIPEGGSVDQPWGTVVPMEVHI